MILPRFECSFHINLSVLEFVVGNSRESVESASAAFVLANRYHLAQARTRALLARGRALATLSQFELASTDLHEALSQCQCRRFAREEALAHEFLGDLARARGDWAAARVEWEKALEIGERIAPRGDVTGEPTRRLSEAALHEALAARAGGDNATHDARMFEALAFARRAFDVNRSCGDRKEEASTLRALGDIALGRRRLNAARRAYEASIAILAEMGARGELALSQQALDNLDSLDSHDVLRGAAPDRAQADHTLPTASTKQPAQSPPRTKSRTRRVSRLATPVNIDDDVIIPLVDPASAPASHIAFTIPEEGWSFVARDPIVLHLVERLSSVAPLDGSVLLLGETGTGKEMLARLVHTASRRTGAFVAANASAFPDSLVESELFGHTRGSFTGASQDKKGLFEAAHGGTFFLDEIGDLPLPTQAKLLRTLEERAVKRVGATETRKIDVRFVAATNVDLRGEMEAGRFRRDLYYRLCAHEFDIPPLRKRGQDALLLVRHLLARRAAQCGKTIAGIAPAAARALLAYPWPGNVRELDNEMQRAASLVPAGRALEATHLSSRIRAAFDAARANSTAAADGLHSDVALLERTRIETALAASGGNQSRAGHLLGMSRQALRYKLLKYQIRPRKIR
ncbi:MAG: sigma 54-interacting transcriptional regulator [bacterium]